MLESLTLIVKGDKPNQRAFLHLPHGKDCPVRFEDVLSPWKEALIKDGKVTLYRCNSKCMEWRKANAKPDQWNPHAPFCLRDHSVEDISSHFFRSALRLIRRDVHGARLSDGHDPDQDRQNF